MLQVLIGIIVIAIVVVCAMYLYQRNLLKKVNALRDQINVIENYDLEARLSDENVTDFSGETLKKFTELRTKYDEKAMPAVAEAVEIADEIEEDFHGTVALSMGGRVKELQDAVDDAKELLDSIQLEVKAFDDEIEAQNQSSDQLRTWFRKYHKELDEQAYKYGDSVTKLNERLTDLEARFNKFCEIADDGDREAAAEVLADVKNGTVDFEELVEQIPELCQPLLQEFPDQLAELKQGYGHLISENYHFTEPDIDHLVEALEVKRQATLERVADLDLTQVKETNEGMDSEIDRLYGVMEQEIDARPKVQQMLIPFAEHLTHAKNQNRLLTNELDRLSISYTLNNDEIATVRQLDEQLKQIEADFNADQKRLEAKTAIDSQILANLQAGEKAMTAVEEQQTEINDSVAELQNDEKLARDAVQRFVADLRATKRHVESLNLPGIPMDYMDFFFLVSDELSQLSKDMNKQQINMDEITKKMLVLQDDFEKLHEKTDSIRDSATLTERVIQYAQRLSMQHPELDDAINRSQQLFSEFEYSRALETIGAAVEDIEPGVFKQIEDSYYREVGKR